MPNEICYCVLDQEAGLFARVEVGEHLMRRNLHNDRSLNNDATYCKWNGY
jgi:hypothetical protein